MTTIKTPDQIALYILDPNEDRLFPWMGVRNLIAEGIEEDREQRRISRRVAVKLPGLRRLGFRVAVGFVGIFALPLSIWIAAAPFAPANALPACETEDQITDCYWDAAQHGGGEGLSFEVRDYVVHYEDGTSREIPASELPDVA